MTKTLETTLGKCCQNIFLSCVNIIARDNSTVCQQKMNFEKKIILKLFKKSLKVHCFREIRMLKFKPFRVVIFTFSIVVALD